MDTSTLVVVAALLILVVVLAFLYRGRLRFALKALGVRAEIEGEGQNHQRAADSERGAHPQTAGDRTIQVGRDAQGALVTGDDNHLTQVRGGHNTVSETPRDTS